MNENKTKDFASTSGEMNLGTTIPIGDYNFEIVKDFVWLGSSVNNNTNVSLEIKRRVTLASRCYFGLSKELSNKALSRKTKLQMYKTLILPVLLYGAETWAITSSDEQVLQVFERKALRKIFDIRKWHTIQFFYEIRCFAQYQQRILPFNP